MASQALFSNFLDQTLNFLDQTNSTLYLFGVKDFQVACVY